MFLKYFIFYIKYIIKNVVYSSGKVFPTNSIKDKQSSPQAWG